MTVVLVAALLLLTPATTHSHSGGLDKFGGHYNHKTGKYHCHKGLCIAEDRFMENPSDLATDGFYEGI